MNDITDEPLEWSRSRMSRPQRFANIIIPACLLCIAGMLIFGGGAL
jgi:hypothetical protein